MKEKEEDVGRRCGGKGRVGRGVGEEEKNGKRKELARKGDGEWEKIWERVGKGAR